VIKHLGDSIQLGRSGGETARDFIEEAMEMLQSADMSLELTENEIAIAMTVFLDGNKAKIFCLAKSENLQLAFLRREIKAIEESY
jgi:hypothetical protein